MILNNKVYDTLKWITLVALPALATFYLALAQSWNFPYPTEIAATIAAVDIFLAALLGVSTSNYKIRVAKLQFSFSDAFGNPNTGVILPKSAYDILTYVAQIVLPALAALYYALAGTWHLGYSDQVVATIMALDTFIGMLLGFSTAQFHKQVAIECIDHPAGLTNLIK